MNILSVSTHRSEELIDITSQLRNYLKSSDTEDGILTVYCPHTTAGLTINENADPDVRRDILYGMDKIVPALKEFHHAGGNSPAHIKASLMGSSVVVIVNKGSMALGRWQGVYLCEFDGPRNRQIYLTYTPGK